MGKRIVMAVVFALPSLVFMGPSSAVPVQPGTECGAGNPQLEAAAANVITEVGDQHWYDASFTEGDRTLRLHGPKGHQDVTRASLQIYEAETQADGSVVCGRQLIAVATCTVLLTPKCDLGHGPFPPGEYQVAVGKGNGPSPLPYVLTWTEVDPIDL